MKYFWIVVFVLACILVGMGSYYIYYSLYFKKTVAKVGNTPADFISNPSPIPTVIQTTSNYYPDSLPVGQTIVIKGRTQAIDPVSTQADGVTYTHVVGILDNNSLSKVWLTDDLYKQMIGQLGRSNYLLNLNVTLTLTRGSVGAVNMGF